MQLTKAIEIIESLADGIDPFTGEPLPSESPYHHPNIVIALHEAARAMEASEKRRKKQKRLLPSRLNFHQNPCPTPLA